MYNVYVKERINELEIRIKKEHNYFITDEPFIFREQDEEIKVLYNVDASFKRVQINSNKFKGITKKELNKKMKKHITELIGEALTIIESGQKVNIDRKTTKEYVFSLSAVSLDYKTKIAKAEAILALDEITLYATNRKYKNDHKPKHNKDAKYGFYEYDITFSIFENNKEVIYTGKLLIRNDANSKKYLYDIISIKN